MFLKLNCKKESGFSLIELLTVMAIIGVISAIVLPNYFAMQKQLALGRAVQKLAHDIRRAQEMAMSARQEPGCPSGYQFGYGVYFSAGASSYNIFADCNNNKDYDSPADKIVDPITFENPVSVKTLNPASPLRVIFTPPKPAVTINYSPSNPTAEITITNGPESKSVKVNKAGLIDD